MSLRKKLIAGLSGTALAAGLVLAGGAAANAADGTIQCNGYRWPYTFSYTPQGVGQPNSHNHQRIDAAGNVTNTKWEGGNYTTVAPWKWDSYTLAGSNKSAWCEN